MNPKWEVICFSSNGKDWFSIKNLQTGEVQLYSFDEWLAYCEDFKKEGIRYSTPKRE